MKIYGNPASPVVQRVLMAARLKGCELAVALPPGGDIRSPEFLKLNPLGRVPVLVEADGWTLAESAAILGYLEDMLDGPPLLPADPRAKAKVNRIASLVMCELDGMRTIMAGAVFGRAVDPAVTAAARAQVAEGLRAIEASRDPDDAFAGGDAPGSADCMLLPMLALIALADPLAHTLGLLDPCPGLRAYAARMETHPIIGRSAREMAAAFAPVLARLGSVEAASGNG